MSDQTARRSGLRQKQALLSTIKADLSIDLSSMAGSLPREIRQVMACIEEHLFDPSLNVNLIRKECGISDNNLSTRFRTAMGIGPHRYIESLRMAAAGRLLSAVRTEIYFVGIAVGYQHPETFCRAFHRHFGHPPSAHRSFQPLGEADTRGSARS